MPIPIPVPPEGSLPPKEWKWVCTEPGCGEIFIMPGEASLDVKRSMHVYEHARRKKAFAISRSGLPLTGYDIGFLRACGISTEGVDDGFDTKN